MLYGRSKEVQRLNALLYGARMSRSGAVIVVSHPGGGKSALLEHAEKLAGGGWRVLRCTGIESESELPFAGLHLLLSPALDRLDALPGPQRDALRGALGLSAVDQVDRFLVGVATLTLLAELSADGPVLCLIDDAQWLDRPSADALLFAARRLGADSIAMLFAGRPEFAAAGLPEMPLNPLAPTDARALLADRWPDLAPEIRDRVLLEAAGNPLAVVELPRMHTETQPPLGPIPLPHRLQAGYQEHMAELPEATRLALLVCAAEETGDLDLVLRVLARLGHSAAALAAAEDSNMVQVSTQTVEFRHPLKRAAAYQMAPFTQRIAVHAAIADMLHDDPDRRAWHLAAATTGPDETVAAALDQAAEHARGRAGYATAATALERAAHLTPDPAARASRLVRAVETAVEAGRTERALRLAQVAERLILQPGDRARLRGARAHVEFEHGSLRKSYDLLLAAAQDAAAVAPDLAMQHLLLAGRVSWTAGDLDGVIRAHAKLAELLPDLHAIVLANGLDAPLRLHSGDRAAAVVDIRANLELSRSIPVEQLTLRLNFVLQIMLIGDLEQARDILTELADEVRARGMVGYLPAVICTLGTAELVLGRFREAAAAATEALRIAVDVGQPARIAQAESNLAYIAAVRGDADRCRELAERNLRQTPGEQNCIDTTHCEWALAMLDMGAGRYELALDRLDAHYHLPLAARGQWIELLSDLVELAARLRRPERAAEAMAEIAEWAEAIATPWADGMALRCRGLLEGDGEMLAESVKLLAAEGRWFQYARSGLLYGEWLRRERRTGEARVQLRKAMEIFDRLGAAPWAEHARTELRAAGEGAVPEVATDAAARLTPQEFQVVRLAAAGATNKEIGAQLFLSPKTVGHHLYRAFPKLGVANRVELARLDLT
ncbi:LuxR C-terminal-related transcriptional regulator [Nocardia sp. NPDC050710]|uniref:ATP-binding protein n=1 Tax=Nocardia sp. NPDC050710 TaxID=3157220 RepID=UPI0033F45E8E